MQNESHPCELSCLLLFFVMNRAAQVSLLVGISILDFTTHHIGQASTVLEKEITIPYPSSPLERRQVFTALLNVVFPLYE